jgi:hypothetical protein
MVVAPPQAVKEKTRMRIQVNNDGIPWELCFVFTIGS